MFIVLITFLMILSEISNALQCHQCTGKKTDNTNPRLYDLFINTASNNGNPTGVNVSTISCTDQDDFGSEITCSESDTFYPSACTFLAFKDEKIKDMEGKMAWKYEYMV